MRVRIVIAALVVCILAGCTMWGEKHKSSWSSATAGEQFERLFWQDVKAKRFDELERHMGATLLVSMPDSTMDRATYLQHLRDLDLKDYSLGDFVTQPSGPDLLVAYRATFVGVRVQLNQPLHQRFRCLGVWQQTKNGWILSARSFSPDLSQ